MTLNIFVVLFVVGMGVTWSTQGLFSSLIHFLLVLIAGTLAFSFWEPVAVGLLMPWIPHLAWSVALLLPFAVLLVGLRTMTDTIVPGNIRLPGIVNSLLGGVIGAASGVLTAGIYVIGTGFMPLPADFSGYQAYAPKDYGQVEELDKLWIPVDTYTNQVFQTLSAGAMASSTPMPLYQPDLRMQSSLVRLRVDERASIVASPEAFSIEQIVSLSLPSDTLPSSVVDQLPQLSESDSKLILVDLKASNTKGTFDSDSTLRLPPAHVRLLAGPDGKSDFVAPIAYSRLVNRNTNQRDLYPLTGGVSADSADQEQMLTWAFVIPTNQKPHFLMIRNLRLDLPTAEDGAELAAGLLGLAPIDESQVAEEPVSTTGTQAGARTGVRTGSVADWAEVTDRLPEAISRNAAAGLDVRRVGEDYKLFTGSGSVRRPQGVQLSRRTRVDGFYVPDHLRLIRVQIAEDRAQSMLGQARAAAASLNGVWLVDARGNQHFPHAYVLSQRDGTQVIKANESNIPFRSARELPTNELRNGAELYLYFQVPRDTEIIEYHVGNTIQDLNLKAE